MQVPSPNRQVALANIHTILARLDKGNITTRVNNYLTKCAERLLLPAGTRLEDMPDKVVLNLYEILSCFYSSLITATDLKIDKTHPELLPIYQKWGENYTMPLAGWQELHAKLEERWDKEIGF